MTLGSVQLQTLQDTGIVCVIAAIVGGGFKHGAWTIPKIISPRRQLLLGAFGAFLLLTSLKVLAPILAAIAAGGGPILFIGFFVALAIISNRRERSFQTALQEHMHSPTDLLDDAEKAFQQHRYDWSLKYCMQAVGEASGETWESACAFMLGAQVALGKKKAAKETRILIVETVQAGTHTGTGHFSSSESLRRFTAQINLIKTTIGRISLFSRPTELDCVLVSIDCVRRQRAAHPVHNNLDREKDLPGTPSPRTADAMNGCPSPNPNTPSSRPHK